MGGDVTKLAKRMLDPLGFYSKGAEEAAKAPQKMSPEAWKSYLLDSKRGVKSTELKHADWEGQTKGIKSLSPGDAADLLQSSAPKLTEDVRYAKDHSELPAAKAANPQEPPERSKWGQYTMPGGSDYEERLLRIPTIEKPLDQWVTRYIDQYGDRASRSWYSPPTPEEYQEWAARQTERGATAIGEPKQLMKPDHDKNFVYPTHWADTPQVVAYLRAKMRGGGDGQRDLFKPGPNKVYSVEEGQSDYAQRGRQFGFKGDPNLPSVDEMRQRYQDASVRNDEHYDPYHEARRAFRNGNISEEQWNAVQAEHQRLADEYQSAMTNYEGAQNRPPPGPSYVMDGDSTTWSNMVNKRALMIAAQRGADGVMIAGPDIHYERWKGPSEETRKKAEGVRTFYRDKFIPSMDKLVKDKSIQDPNAPNRRMDMDPSDIQDLRRGDSKFLVHQFDQNGYHARTHGPFDSQAEANEQLNYYRSNYPEHSFDQRPYIENPDDLQQPKVGPQPTWGLSDTSRDLIQKFGWPYFKQGGAVEQHGDEIDGIIEEAHEIARKNPDLVKRALAILQSHAKQGEH